MIHDLCRFAKGGNMMEPTGKLEPANWEITAFSLQCDHISEVVTVRVTRDWAATCAWYLKHKADAIKQMGKAVKRSSIDKCLGPNCPIVTKYREKLVQEEFGNEQGKSLPKK